MVQYLQGFLADASVRLWDVSCSIKQWRECFIRGEDTPHFKPCLGSELMEIKERQKSR
jgi:hypothetical protein